MTEAAFPRDTFVHTVVQLLDTIQHQDTNYTHEERVRNLSYAYNEAARHFAQPHVRDSLHVKPKKLQAALQTITGMVVYCWVKASPELMAALTIHYTYTLILDDDEDDPYPTMENFFDDMVGGKEQKHPWWRLVNDHFPNVLKHYGPFCSLNIYRSTVDCEFYFSLWGALALKNMSLCSLLTRYSKSLRVAGSSSMPFTAIRDLQTIPTFSGA